MSHSCLKNRRWSSSLQVLFDCVCQLLLWSSGGSVLDYLGDDKKHVVVVDGSFVVWCVRLLLVLGITTVQ